MLMHEPKGENGRLRIGYIVHTFDTGGLERCVANLCNHLDRDRFQPLIVCLTRAGTAAQWIARGDVPIIGLHKRSGNDVRVVARLSKSLREHRVDIAHSHNWGTLVETAIARRWAGTPVHVHAERGTVAGRLHDWSWTGRLRRLAMRWALRRANLVMSNSAAVAERVAARSGYPAARVQLIPNGVLSSSVPDPMRARTEIRSQLGIPRSAFVAGSVGRLHAVKGFSIGIEAVASLGPRAHLLLIGDGPVRDELSMHATSLGVSDRVHFVGEQNDIGRWLAAMDVYVNTSYSEGMSQSILEAMAAGLPLVVTDVGDNAMLAGTSGLVCGTVVPSGDQAAVAAAMKQLRDDANLRARYAHNARRVHGSSFSLSAMIGKYAACYQQVWCCPSKRESRPVPPTARALQRMLPVWLQKR